MVLMIGFYDDADPARRGEFLECISRNAANTHIEQLVVFIEDEAISAAMRECFPVLCHPKIRLLEHGRRLTYWQLFAYANLHLKGSRVIVANADIFFDETLGLLEEAALSGKMLCFSRWDQATDGTLRLFDCPESQDAWMFEPPIPQIAAEFCLGKPGCDNRLAYEAECAGLVVLNPSRSVRARHLHNSAVRRYTQYERLQGPTRAVPVSFLEAPVSVTHLRDLLGTLSSRTPGPPRPSDAPLAAIAFREAMGYTVTRLEGGVSTHNNDPRPLVSVPAELVGLPFTQVVANHAEPVEIEFRTRGRLFVLAAPGWEGYGPAAEFLDGAGWRDSIEPLRTRDGTTFEVWSLYAEAGERLRLPTQVMLATAELVRLG
jgi:hypothetical protein